MREVLELVPPPVDRHTRIGLPFGAKDLWGGVNEVIIEVRIDPGESAVAGLADPGRERHFVPLRRAVVGIDFSRASIRAARAAVSLTTPPGHVWLAHVNDALELPGEAYEGAAVVYTQAGISTFKKIEERLEPVDLLEVRPVVLEGKTADQLLAFSASHRADLLVTGAQGHTLVERLLIGSVTTKLLRAAQCSLLVIPPFRAFGEAGLRTEF